MKRELCSVCNKRAATVFVTQIDQSGNQVNKGLCIVCAKKLNLPQVNQFLEKMNVSDEDIEAIADEMTGMMEQMDGENGENGSMNGDAAGEKGTTNTPNIMDMIKRFSQGLGGAAPKAQEGQENGGAAGAESVKNDKGGARQDKSGKAQPKFKFLTMYGTDLTGKAEDGKIDNIVGRGRETDRVIQIINRRTKNNPVLVGEAGVGKTAIAEGLALKIARKEVPEKLLDKRI